MVMQRRYAALFCIFLMAGLSLSSIPVNAGGNLEDSGSNIDILAGETATWLEFDENKVIFLSTDGLLQIHDFVEGEHSLIFEMNGLPNSYVAVPDSSNTLVALGTEDGILVVDLNTQNIVQNFSTTFPVTALAWDIDGDIWAGQGTGTRNAHEYTVTGTATGQVTYTHSIGLTDVAVLPDGRVATSGNDKLIFINNFTDGTSSTLNEHEDRVLSLAVDSEGRLLSTSSGGTLIRYDTSDWTYQSLETGSTNQLEYLMPTDDEIHLGSNNGVYHSVDSSSLTSVENYQIGGQIRGADRGPEGQLYLLASLSTSTTVRLFDVDSDGDGTINSKDDFPNDANETSDSDYDGVGDNSDVFPEDPSEHSDRDGDGVGDNSDVYPDDEFEYKDTDGDGHGDNGDEFPEDSTQWEDWDNDGLGDNPLGNNPDDCPSVNGGSSQDRNGCLDSDGDGWSDPDDSWPASPNGSADAFPNERTQWADSDEDGHGDDPNGKRGDACPGQWGDSRYALFPITSNDGSVIDYERIEQFGCPDGDGDGYADHLDHLPEDPNEYRDVDGDGIGAKTDYDDENAAIKTQEDWCANNPEDSSDYCSGLKDTEYQAYVQETEDDGGTPMGYYSWRSTKQTTETQEQTKDSQMDERIEQALKYGGILFVGLVALLLIVNGLMKMGRKRSFTKSFGDSNFSPEASLAELAAHESGESFEAMGGVIEEDGWGDEVAPMEMDTTAETNYGDEMSMEELAGMPSSSPAQPVARQPPSVAPPVPAEGLPPGWTEDQWKWYGHEWLANNRR